LSVAIQREVGAVRCGFFEEEVVHDNLGRNLVGVELKGVWHRLQGLHSRRGRASFSSKPYGERSKKKARMTGSRYIECSIRFMAGVGVRSWLT
jgi:hypothetical protein